MNNKKFLLLIVLFATCSTFMCSKSTRKKVLYVNSYHEGYAWSDGITKGIKSVIEPAGVDLEIISMDTKRNPSEDFIKKAALKAKKFIEEYKPDVVIASDDTASKYLIVPYYKNSKLPFVFCGVNWDAKVYGFPSDHVTGMVEVALTSGLIKYMRDHAKGDKIGFISYDSMTEYKIAKNYKKKLKIKLAEEKYVKTAAEWKKAFLEIQDRVDMLIIGNFVGIKNWNEKEMQAWILDNTKIPTGTSHEWVVKYTLIGLTKIPEEQGKWAAGAALKILSGISPKDIPVAENREGKIIINTRIADKLKIKFLGPILESAEKIE